MGNKYLLSKHAILECPHGGKVGLYPAKEYIIINSDNALIVNSDILNMGITGCGLSHKLMLLVTCGLVLLF